MGEWPAQVVSDFRGKALPEAGEPAGYAALITRYELDLPSPPRMAAIAGRHHPVSNEDWLMLTPRHRPDRSLGDQLTFAFRYEGVDLQVLSSLFETVPPEDIATLVRAAPTGGFARRLWFLYEWLTERQLDVPDPGKVRLIPVLDADQQYALAEGEPSQFKVLQAGQAVAEVQWAIGGVHNQLNALASIAAAGHLGVSPTVAAQALASFENVKRRMEVRGTVNGVTVYDDFAHHPTAIRTTVNGLRRQVGNARILAIFEPRSNTMRLGTMKAQLPWSLEEADLAFCHSGGLGWDAVTALAPMGPRAQVSDTIEGVVALVMAQVQPGDHLLCMSNGGFGGIHARLLAALAR